MALPVVCAGTESDAERYLQMFCKNCGANVPDGQNVCPSCGTAVSTPSAAPSAAPASSSAPSFKLPGGMDAQKFLAMVKPSGKKPNFISLGGAVVALICMFLPFAKVSVSLFGMSQSESISLWSGDCWFLTFLFALVAGYSAFISSHYVTIGAGALGLIEAIRQAASISGDELGELSSMAKVSKGIGCWLLFIATVVVIGGAVFTMLQEKKNPQQAS